MNGKSLHHIGIESEGGGGTAIKSETQRLKENLSLGASVHVCPHYFLISQLIFVPALSCPNVLGSKKILKRKKETLSKHFTKSARKSESQWIQTGKPLHQRV